MWRSTLITSGWAFLFSTSWLLSILASWVRVEITILWLYTIVLHGVGRHTHVLTPKKALIWVCSGHSKVREWHNMTDLIWIQPKYHKKRFDWLYESWKDCWERLAPLFGVSGRWKQARFWMQQENWWQNLHGDLMLGKLVSLSANRPFFSNCLKQNNYQKRSEKRRKLDIWNVLALLNKRARLGWLFISTFTLSLKGSFAQKPWIEEKCTALQGTLLCT